MKIIITTSNDGKSIGTICEIHNPQTKGEVAHFIAEIERIKLDLLDLWEEVANWKE